ncbi:impB/mucB/samB family protein [Microdochium trichocladiopsis]|uniref:DNA repair protein REV1 n=1 Tax=Microdochium trichocladiopsis TaxID=1682393 RepID=A0A9P9BQR3_9PEZI|nr:impB/mucB/samB family protein [Microdochium trichocladiopsis]KAH7035158.1 impB/mucB/samB family protein [Microdochium trichocladiopsis]
MNSRLDKNSTAVRKRIEEHHFDDEHGEEYEASAFGGFPEYFRRKKIKLQNLDSELRAASADKPKIFKGVVAHVTGYTQPPLHVLHHDLVSHGAGFIQYLDGKTMATHIIASSLPPKKSVEFNKYRIVKPAWVTDSIKAGKLLPWNDYRVLDEGARQKTLKFDDGSLSTQSRSQQTPARYREQTDNSFYTSQLRTFAEAIDGKSSDNDKITAHSPRTSAIASSDDWGGPPQAPAKKVTPVQPLGESERAEDSVAATDNHDRTPDFRTEADSKRDASSAPVAPADQMTSEEHNAMLLQDPHMRKSSTANPAFLQQYYSESRLHHLSSWKADLKSRMQKLAAEKGLGAKVGKRKPGSRRYVLHVDFDSFFCAVSLKRAPEFADKPAVVAHGNGSGSEIASCNYPARKFGVKNGMWMKRAKELCPDLKVLPYDFPAYEEASALFYECILETGGVVQSVSIDEALVDVTSVILAACGSDGTGVDEGSIWREQDKADEIAASLRTRIKAKTACEVSVGVGSNILLAKVALRKAKPAGQYQIKPDEVLTILGGLKVDDLPGVAYSIAGKLEEIGIKFVDDIRQTSKERLIGTLGPKTGEKLWEYARGIDRVEVGDQVVRKSVSAEVNWGIRFINQEEAEEFVYNLCKELEKRLVNEQVKGKQLTMKIMRRSLDAPLDPPKHLGHGKCDTFNKSTLFGVATHDYRILGKEAVSILRSYKFSPGDLRGLGVQLTKLEPIKAMMHGADSSQKKLNFGTFRTPAVPKRADEEQIQDINNDRVPSLSPSRAAAQDPIQDGPITPKKPKGHPALQFVKARGEDLKANTPLNLGGTQFIIPTNPDPAVLAELPQDIRSRLLAQHDRASRSREATPAAESGASTSLTTFRVPDGLDPEVFHALPDDMKAEVLASYARENQPNSRPQSPRKDRLITTTKKTTPTKRRVPGLFARTKERQADASARVVQTSLPSNGESLFGIDDVEELDPEILAALPADVRKEVIAEHRRKKAQRSGLDLKINQRKLQDIDGMDDALQGGQMRLHFPARPTKVAFTSGGLKTLVEIRDMLTVWFNETQADGPHQRDVEMLEKYLVKVVLEEKDMGKAVKLVKWLDFLADDSEDVAAKGRGVWMQVVQKLRTDLDTAMKCRGLGSLNWS